MRTPTAERTDIRGDPFVECQLTGFKVRYSETVIQWDGRRVHKDFADKMPASLIPETTYPNEGKSIGGGLRESADTDVPNLPSGSYSDPWADLLQ